MVMVDGFVGSEESQAGARGEKRIEFVPSALSLSTEVETFLLLLCHDILKMKSLRWRRPVRSKWIDYWQMLYKSQQHMFEESRLIATVCRTVGGVSKSIVLESILRQSISFCR